MSTARLARNIRKQLRTHHKERLTGRRLLYRFPRLLETSYNLAIILAATAFAAGILVVWSAGRPETIIMINAIASIVCVLLLGKVKYYYDSNDFPRLGIIAVVPWTYRQWLCEYLRNTPRLLIIPGCFSLVQMLAIVAQPQSGGQYRYAFAFAAAAAQSMLIVGFALCLIAYSLPIIRFTRLADWIHRAAWIAVAAIASLLWPTLADYAIVSQFPTILLAFPTAWPVGILRASAGMASYTTTILGLVGCGLFAVVLLGVAFARFSKSLRLAEIIFLPTGAAYAISEECWQAYQAWINSSNMPDAVTQSPTIPNQTPSDSSVAVDEDCEIPENEYQSDKEPDTTVEVLETPSGNCIDDFWNSQGWITSWLSPQQRNVVAMQHLAFDSACSLKRYFCYYSAWMLILAVGFWFSAIFFPSIGFATLPLLLGLMVLGMIQPYGPVAVHYRALPLSTHQWLWPIVKYQSLRMLTLVVPATVFISGVMWFQNFQAAEIFKTLSWALPAPFVSLIVVRLTMFGQETRDRYRSLKLYATAFFATVIVLCAIGAVIASIGYAWPVNLLFLPLVFASLGVLWKLNCFWHDNCQVDHYVPPRD